MRVAAHRRGPTKPAAVVRVHTRVPALDADDAARVAALQEHLDDTTEDRALLVSESEERERVDEDELTRAAARARPLSKAAAQAQRLARMNPSELRRAVGLKATVAGLPQGRTHAARTQPRQGDAPADAEDEHATRTALYVPEDAPLADDAEPLPPHADASLLAAVRAHGGAPRADALPARLVAPNARHSRANVDTALQQLLHAKMPPRAVAALIEKAGSVDAVVRGVAVEAARAKATASESKRALAARAAQAAATLCIPAAGIPVRAADGSGALAPPHAPTPVAGTATVTVSEPQAAPPAARTLRHHTATASTPATATVVAPRSAPPSAAPRARGASSRDLSSGAQVAIIVGCIVVGGLVVAGLNYWAKGSLGE